MLGLKAYRVTFNDGTIAELASTSLIDVLMRCEGNKPLSIYVSDRTCKAIDQKSIDRLWDKIQNTVETVFKGLSKMSTRNKVMPANNDFKTGNINDYLEKLEPSKGGKYICPVCSGNDLSISKDGAPTCFNSGCSWKSIMDIIAPLKKIDRDKAYRKEWKPPTKKEIDHKAHLANIEIDIKTDEFAYAASYGNIESARALSELAAWCKVAGHDKFSASKLFQSKLTALKQARTATGEYQDGEDKPRLLIEYELIKKRFGDRLKFNELRKQVELDGILFEPITAKVNFTIFHKCSLKSAREDIADLVILIAKSNTYSPVRDYLDQVSAIYGNEIEILNDVARRHLGADKKIHDVAVMRWLISCVARAYKPGCKVDVALILQGKQGFLKSTFFNILASDEFFDDSVSNASEKEEKLKLHRTWIVEWAELETVFRRKDVSVVKALMSSKIDILRPPYGRSYEVMFRPSAFCGTSNQSEFLADSTGNRRFWVIPVTRKIDAGLLQNDRDRIWAAAVALYRAGVQWWLTDGEEEVMGGERAQFESSDSWLEDIESFCEGKDLVAIADILSKCLDIPIGSHDRKHQARIKEILIQIGYKPQPNPVWAYGEKRRYWKKD